jgi:hypothetical protein
MGAAAPPVPASLIVSYISSYKKCTIKYKLGDHMCYYYYYYKIETTLQPEAELRGLHIITCTTYKYIINTIL